MSNKTAMMELMEAIKFTDKETYNTLYADGVFDGLLEKEKEQMYDFFMEGYDNGMNWNLVDINPDSYVDKIYNETYKQEDEIKRLQK